MSNSKYPRKHPPTTASTHSHPSKVRFQNDHPSSTKTLLSNTTYDPSAVEPALNSFLSNMHAHNHLQSLLESTPLKPKRHSSASVKLLTTGTSGKTNSLKTWLPSRRLLRTMDEVKQIAVAKGIEEGKKEEGGVEYRDVGVQCELLVGVWSSSPATSLRRGRKLGTPRTPRIPSSSTAFGRGARTGPTTPKTPRSSGSASSAAFSAGRRATPKTPTVPAKPSKKTPKSAPQLSGNLPKTNEKVDVPATDRSRGFFSRTAERMERRRQNK